MRRENFATFLNGEIFPAKFSLPQFLPPPPLYDAWRCDFCDT